MNDNYLTLFFTILGIFVFSFMYWRDATKEGYSSDKIFDSIILIITLGLIGGKVLFRPFNIDYFRYQFLSAPLVLEGILIGGGLAAYLVVQKNKWDPWKIGDMIAPGLAIFQAILFFGFWFRSNLSEFIYISLSFVFLYTIIISFKKRLFIGSGLNYSFLKRLNKPIFSGGLIAIYLTGSSLIAILFLLTHINQTNWFWWFQLLFYLIILISTIIFISRRFRKQEVKVSSYFSTEFKNKIMDRLRIRKREIKSEEKDLPNNDPFIQEYISEGSRNLDSIEEEASDMFEHNIVEATEQALEQEEKAIDETLERIHTDQFGKCLNCGNLIETSRLEALPTAKYCIKCAPKFEK